MIMVVGVELVNFLAVLDQSTFSDMVMNFTALVIISEFDDFFFSAYKDSDLKDVILNKADAYSEILMIRRTSSRDAKLKLNQNLMAVDKCEKNSEFIKNEGSSSVAIPQYIYVDFWRDRTCANKLLYMVYRIFKCVYTSFWYYFMPYSTIVCSFVFPLAAN